jgi:AraC-like DNA-binding protein
MEKTVEQAVRHVIESWRDKLDESITIDDMARTAMFSKFHFSRLFQRTTGVSPGRFLSAVRLEAAKRLLASTSMSITEISHQVGYTSVGTFSSRFRSSVGLSPTLYRRLGGLPSEVCAEPLKNPAKGWAGRVRGLVRPPTDGDTGLVFVGLFPHRVPQGRPMTCTILNRPGPFVLDNVPAGTWYLLSHSLSADRHEVLRPDREDHGLFVGSLGPITTRANVTPQLIDLQLRAKRVIDPPVLLALLDLRTEALSARTG